MSREEKEFLINGTVLKCTEGDKETEFNVPEKNLKIQGFSAANEEDNVAGINILPFGKCKIRGEECRLDKELMGQKLQWQNILKVSICGKNSLLDDSFCLCPIGGIIEVVESKQIDFGAEYMKYTENIQEELATINELFGALEYSMSIVPFEVWKAGIDPVMTNSNYENVNNTYMRLHSDPTMTAEKWNNRYRKREDVSSTMKKNPNDLIPKFSLKELFSKGTSVEGIMELHSVGVDSQNKKMIPGIFGGDVKISALTAGYTEYTSDETYEIVSSLSEKGKAAYKLRTRANKGQDIYKAGVEVSGIVYAGYRTYKTNKSGKVRVGKAPVVVEKKPVKDGEMRAKQYRDNWGKASLQETIKKVAGENTMEIHNVGKGKVSYLNTETGKQVVYDYKGNYFRIQDTKILKGRNYLNLNGENPFEFITERGTKQGTPSVLYKQWTHFLNND